MAARGEAEAPGFSREKVSFRIVLSRQGEPVQVLDLRQASCDVDSAQWAGLRARLMAEIDPDRDSLRFYRLGADGKRRVEHIGAKAILDLDGPLVF